MKNTAGGSEPELGRLLARIQHLKSEHGPLLAKIQRDRGMSVELRRELLAHLEDEEAEIVTKLAAISPILAARYRPGAPGPRVGAQPLPHANGATQSQAAGQRLTVGSLRGDTPAATRTAGGRDGLSIGSLRPR